MMKCKGDDASSHHSWQNKILSILSNVQRSVTPTREGQHNNNTQCRPKAAPGVLKTELKTYVVRCKCSKCDATMDILRLIHVVYGISLRCATWGEVGSAAFWAAVAYVWSQSHEMNPNPVLRSGG